MAGLINDTPTIKSVVIHRGAPKPLVFRRRQGGVLRSFDSSLVMRVTHPGGSFDLSVGSGITLVAEEGVANALVSATLSPAQSRLVPVGNFARFEFQETAAGGEVIVMMGSLIGKGGENAGA